MQPIVKGPVLDEGSADNGARVEHEASVVHERRHFFQREVFLAVRKFRGVNSAIVVVERNYVLTHKARHDCGSRAKRVVSDAIHVDVDHDRHEDSDPDGYVLLHVPRQDEHR